MSTPARQMIPSWVARTSLQFVVCLLLFLPACAATDSSRALLELSVNPALLQADGTGSVTIQYHVARQATVSIVLRSAAGTSFSLRERVARGPGDYAFAFRGAVAGRVLPNGEYEVVATAQAAEAGESAEQRRPLTIANADTAAPAVENLRVAPAVLTPNQDGVDDRLAVTFTVTEPVTVDARLLVGAESRWLVQAFAAGPGAVDISWPSPLRHAPQLNQAVERLPAGPAVIEVAVQDRAGNRTVQRQSIALGETGTPQVQVSDVQVSPTTVQAGATITVAATITNTGTVTLRAAQPGPDAYAWGQDAPTLGYAAAAGSVRWGVDFSFNRSGIGYPFRWSLGSDLAPGQSVAVSGTITVNEHFPQEPVQVWLGVIHESNRMLADKRGITRVQLANPDD